MKQHDDEQRAPSSANEEAFLKACADGDLSEVLHLLNSGISPNISAAAGWTPLHYAAIRNQAHLIEPLVVAGANLEGRTAVNPSKWRLHSFCTPLHSTIEWDALEAARELVRLGADLNARDSDGQTPLRLAVETSGTYHLVSASLAKFLIEAGADINAYDNGDYTIFHEASNAADLAPWHQESQEVIEMLQERKAWMW